MMMNKNETQSCTKHGWRMIGLLLIGAMMPLIISCGMKQEKKQSIQIEQPVVKEINQPSAMELVTPPPVECEGEFDESDVFLMVETMPAFPGGMGPLITYLRDNIKYPESAQKAGLEGRVIVQFIVSKTAEITNPVVIHSVNAALDAEAIRVVTSMPKWSPGEQQGKKVKVRYRVPVTFRLKE